MSRPNHEDHSVHCDDWGCGGCQCTPDCDYWDEEPNVLEERKRIIALLERSCLDHNIYETPCGSFGEAVSLIKGELND